MYSEDEGVDGHLVNVSGKDIIPFLQGSEEIQMIQLI